MPIAESGSEFKTSEEEDTTLQPEVFSTFFHNLRKQEFVTTNKETQNKRNRPLGDPDNGVIRPGR